jgi:hypothetical protein
MLLFFNIRSATVSKHSELVKRHAWGHYGRFAFPSRHTAPHPSCHEVGSSNRRRTAPPPSRMQEVGRSSRRCTAPSPSRQEEASSDDSVEMWVAAPTPPPLRLQVVPSSSFDTPCDSSSSFNTCGGVVRWLPLGLLRLQRRVPPRQRGELIWTLLLDFSCLV